MLLNRSAGDEQMQASADHMDWTGTEVEDLAPEETRSVPFLGFVASTVLSVVFWAAIGWAVWAVMN